MKLKLTNALFVISVLLSLSSGVMANSPQLNLFPQSVHSSFKAAEKQTLRMQDEISRISIQMKELKQQFIANKCDKSNESYYCLKLKKQMSDKFAELNLAIKRNLPELKQAVDTAHKSMGNSLKHQANKYTSSQLIKINHQIRVKSKPKQTSKTSLGKIAKVFSKMNKALGSKQTNLYVLASQTYNDLTHIKTELDKMGQNVDMNLVISNLGIQVYDINDDTVNTVSNVREYVMGEVEYSELPVYPYQEPVHSYDEQINRILQ